MESTLTQESGFDLEKCIVYQNLQAQREAWQKITASVCTLGPDDFPHEPPKRFVFTGLGSSYYAARLISWALLRDKTRTRVPIVAVPSTAVGNEWYPKPGDWLFAISHRGSPSPTIKSLDIAEQAGAFTVQVSGEGAPESPSAKLILKTVPIETVEPHTISMTGAICAVTSLLLGTKGIEEWDALRSVGNPDLDLMRRRAGMGPQIILGECEGEWLAREGALKLMEMARHPVRAYGSEEYFHGPRFATSDKDVLWHVSVPHDPRNQQIKSAHRIDLFGATPLAWVPALIELQWLALAVALNLGVDPDLK